MPSRSRSSERRIASTQPSHDDFKSCDRDGGPCESADDGRFDPDEEATEPKNPGRPFLGRQVDRPTVPMVSKGPVGRE